MIGDDARPNRRAGGRDGPAAVSDELLAGPLSLARRLLDGVRAFAVSLAELGDIELPPLVGPEVDASHVRVVAPLYLASELESARLLPAAETLAGLFASGGLPLADSQAASQLYRFWQGRHSRFARAEREAFFARLFGAPARAPLAVEGGVNRAFEGAMLRLAEAVARAAPDPIFGRDHSAAAAAALGVAAEALLANLLPRSGDLAAYAANDIIQANTAAIAVLKLRPVQAAVGAASVWSAVQAISSRYLGESADVSAHVRRGAAGMTLLAWLADAVPWQGRDTRELLVAGHAIAAAADWLQASLALHAPAIGLAPGLAARAPTP